MIAEQTEHPLLLNGEMVRAVLAGRKTQTRRPMNPQPQRIPGGHHQWKEKLIPSALACEAGFVREPLAVNFGPFGNFGDRLWVRETWNLRYWHRDWETGLVDDWDFWEGPLPPSLPQGYALDFQADYFSADEDEGMKWRPSIHMPRWAARITLDVKHVWVERLHDISDNAAKAEGVERCSEKMPSHRRPFAKLWDSIYGKPGKDGLDLSWAANPWVWCCEFDVAEVKQ